MRAGEEGSEVRAQGWLFCMWKALSQESCLQSFCAQSCPTLCNPMDCGPPGSSVHGIFQAGNCHFQLQGDLPNPGMEPTSLASPALAGRFFTTAPPGLANSGRDSPRNQSIKIQKIKKYSEYMPLQPECGNWVDREIVKETLFRKYFNLEDEHYAVKNYEYKLS